MTSTSTPTAAGYIATDREGTAIYGIGATAEEAIADARTASNDPESEYVVLGATAALLDRVRTDGGGPGIRWEVVNHDGSPAAISYAAEYGDPERYVATLEVEPDDHEEHSASPIGLSRLA